MSRAIDDRAVDVCVAVTRFTTPLNRAPRDTVPPPSTPQPSMGRGGDVEDTDSSDRRAVSYFFFGCFLLILFACLCAVAIVHTYWNRRAAVLRAQREAEDELINPWAHRERIVNARAGRQSHSQSREGSFKDGSTYAGSIIRGVMFGAMVMNPSGSFTFGSSKTITNEREVTERKAKMLEVEQQIVRAAEEARRNDELVRNRMMAMGTEFTGSVAEHTSSMGNQSGNHNDSDDIIGTHVTITLAGEDPWAQDTSLVGTNMAFMGTTEGWEPRAARGASEASDALRRESGSSGGLSDASPDNV